MCGRFALKDPAEADKTFDSIPDESIAEMTAPPRFNIAPTQPIHVVANLFGKRVTRLMRWGLMPDWVKDPSDFPLLINAREETAASKPAFRAAIRHRRAIVPASGFYEWNREGGHKTPYYFTAKESPIFGFAALYETYMGKDGSEIDTACLLTTDATADISAIHHRMPITISPSQAEKWLDPVGTTLDEAYGILRASAHEGVFQYHPVSKAVNSARNDGAELIEQVALEVKADAQHGEETSGKDRNDQLDLF